MQSHSFRSIGRFLLAACAVGLGVSSLSAQTAPSATALNGPNPSRVDVFMGYSYFGSHGSLNIQPNAPIHYTDINAGAIGSVAYYFNRYFGAEAIYSNHPNGVNDGFSGASVGAIMRYPMQNMTAFAHGLVGGGRLGGPDTENSFMYHNPYQWGPALTAGGGLDYNLNWMHNRFGLRLFQIDYRYIHEDFGPITPPPTGGQVGGRANLPAVELSTGILIHFGSIVPPPPVTYTCAATPASVYPGDPVMVTGTAVNLNPKMTATYSWTSDAGPVMGSSSTANINTATLSAGTYTVKGHVSEGTKPGQMADCSAQFTVRAIEPPTISCSANPSTVRPGDSSTITSYGRSPQNRPLTYSYSATAGSISGSMSTATLSTTGARGTITVTCNVVDDKGQTASAMTSVSVLAPPPPPPPPAPMASNLCTVSFDRDKARPTRVDNEAKACLDDIALNMQRSSDAKLALVGNDKPSKKKRAAERSAEERAVNTKAYLVKEKGIDASRIMVYTGTAGDNTVTTTLIPAGATMNTMGDTPVDESMIHAQPRKAAPAKKKKM